MPRDKRSTYDRQMYIAKLQEKTNLSMAWIDYKKAYDMVPHSWITTTMGMVGLADNIIGLIKQSMNRWKTNLYANGKPQGDLLSPLLFVIALLPLTHILRYRNGVPTRKEWRKSQPPVLHGRLKTVWEE